jgi:hypothetical protein
MKHLYPGCRKLLCYFSFCLFVIVSKAQDVSHTASDILLPKDTNSIYKLIKLSDSSPVSVYDSCDKRQKFIDVAVPAIKEGEKILIEFYEISGHLSGQVLTTMKHGQAKLNIEQLLIGTYTVVGSTLKGDTYNAKLIIK